MADTALLGPAADGAEFVRLRGIEAFGYHGVFPEERREGQWFVVDVTCQLKRTSRVDNVATTVDYGTLAQAVVANVENDPVDLIETLADRLASLCLGDELVDAVVVTIHKPQAPMPVPVTDAAVTVVRRR